MKVYEVDFNQIHERSRQHNRRPNFFPFSLLSDNKKRILPIRQLKKIIKITDESK